MESDTIIFCFPRVDHRAKPARHEISAFWERAARYVRKNYEAAGIILQDADRHGGETAGLVIWARMTLARAAQRRAV